MPQQDKDPKDSAKLVLELLKGNIKLLKLASESSNLKSFENLWPIIQK